MNWLKFGVLLSVCGFLCSCESINAPASYGYYTSGLDDQTIRDFFELTDQAVNERDYDTYKDLFKPGWYSIDKSERRMSMEARLSLPDYMDMIRDLFKHARDLSIYSMITDIEYIEPGTLARVTVQEDQTLDYEGADTRFTSMWEIDVGFDDGWIYYVKSTKLASQEIKD